jgi:hypothetical protein
MKKPQFALFLSACSALAIACDSTAEPDVSARVLTRIEISPVTSALRPGTESKVQITAWDQYGTRIVEPRHDAWIENTAYFTSAPEIANVSRAGAVTGVAPGVARITAVLSLGSVTATAVMTLTVYDPAEVAKPAGDLTASNVIEGTFGTGGHIAGLFSAKRR